MPGFKPERTTYRLTFEDVPSLAGLEVRIRSCTVRELNKMSEGGDSQEDNDEATELFVSKLISWNIVGEDDQPVPTTVDGVESLEPGLVASIIVAWQKAMITVNDPLRRDSSNGRSSEEASLGLGASSQSLPSSTGPS